LLGFYFGYALLIPVNSKEGANSFQNMDASLKINFAMTENGRELLKTQTLLDR
jgi:hypothetical protein